jgi:hypothetical protein
MSRPQILSPFPEGDRSINGMDEETPREGRHVLWRGGVSIAIGDAIRDVGINLVFQPSVGIGADFYRSRKEAFADQTMDMLAGKLYALCVYAREVKEQVPTHPVIPESSGEEFVTSGAACTAAMSFREVWCERVANSEFYPTPALRSTSLA